MRSAGYKREALSKCWLGVSVKLRAERTVLGDSEYRLWDSLSEPAKKCLLSQFGEGAVPQGVSLLVPAIPRLSPGPGLRGRLGSTAPLR